MNQIYLYPGLAIAPAIVLLVIQPAQAEIDKSVTQGLTSTKIN